MRPMTHCISAALVIAVSLTATAAAAQGARQLPTAGGMAAGYSGAGASTGAPTDFSLRDASGNLVIVNGQLQTGAGYEPGYRSGGGFGQTAIALGNQLTVQASGSWNVIIVDAVQTNTGDITAHAGAASARAGQTR
jgi:holdfast attachment protein HfaA